MKERQDIEKVFERSFRKIKILERKIMESNFVTLTQKVIKYTYAAEKNKITERRDRRENNVWDGWANLWGIRRRKSVESVNWDELKSIVCVEEPSGTLHTSA
jgi:hypothetical protein